MTDQSDNTTDKPTGKWVSIQEAVGILGVTERTVRRRAKVGKLESRKEFGRLYVLISGLESDDQQAGVQTAPDLQALQAEIDRLTSVLKEVRSERDYLRQLLGVTLAADPQRRIESSTDKKWWEFWK